MTDDEKSFVERMRKWHETVREETLAQKVARIRAEEEAREDDYDCSAPMHQIVNTEG
jgi:hypothetical protein